MAIFTALCFRYRALYFVARKELADTKARMSLDSLTMLPGREQAKEAFTQLDEEVRRRAEQHPASETDRLFVVFLDLCDFSKWNERPSGHSFGDQVLREVAAFFSREKKGQDFVGRWGGDEFLMLLIAKGNAIWPALRSRQMSLKNDGLFVDSNIIEVLFRCGVAQAYPEEMFESAEKQQKEPLSQAEKFELAVNGAQSALRRIDKTIKINPDDRSTYFELAAASDFRRTPNERGES